MNFPGGAGRWGMRRSTVREHGLPLQLLVISDLTQPLREQELQAWQRLVRVLGHELNNSLTPIKSIAGSLGSLLARRPLPDDWEDDMRRGLTVISTRSESAEPLHRRVCAAGQAAAAAIAADGDAALGCGRVVSLETRLPVAVEAGAGHHRSRRSGPAGAGAHQSAAQCRRRVAEHRRRRAGRLDAQRLAVEVWIEDEGPGISNTTNLFVPFFTTKPGGSGIGLVLSRQIAEAHGGTLMLENRTDRAGCVARLRLPV